jgi:hypothetical protein
MVYFGKTNIPGLFNVVDDRGVLIATDATMGQLKQLAAQHGGAEYVPPPVPMVELPGGVSFPLGDICA